MRGVDSIGKIKPYMFSFFCKIRKRRAGFIISFGSLLTFWGGLEIWSGHFNFRSFFVFFFFVFFFQQMGEFFYGD